MAEVGYQVQLEAAETSGTSGIAQVPRKVRVQRQLH